VLSATTLRTDRHHRARLVEHFTDRTRAVVQIPYDPAISTGQRLDLSDLRPARPGWPPPPPSSTDSPPTPNACLMHNPYYPPTEDRSSTPYPGGYPNPAAVELTVEPDGGGALDGPSGGPPPGFDCSRLIRNSVHQASPPRIRTAVHRQFVVATTPRGRDGWTGPPVTHTDYVTLARTGSGWRFAAYMTTGRAAWS